jgi:hypothetical protein
MRNSEICGEIRGKKIIFHKKFFFVREELFLVVKIYPENQEKTACVEYSSVFSPPEELQIPENSNNALSPNASGNESSQSISSSSSSLVNSRRDSPSEDTNDLLHDLSSALHDIDSKSSSATITPVTKSFPK